MRRSYLDYAMSVIVSRALPDVRDGLKPVHRRILYTQHGLNNVWNRSYIKGARVVGDVLGKYHPHGDTAAYDALVRMAHDCGIRYPLVHGQEHPKTGRKSIVTPEIPYQVNKARLIEKIDELVRDKRLEGVADIRDESDRDGMRIVIDLKKDAVPEVVQNNLWKMTPMQESFGINMLAIVEGRPQILSLKNMLVHYIAHRRDVVTRRTMYELRAARDRMHILE